MPTYRYGTTDYNQMAVKPADNDGMCFFDTSEDRLMTMYYGTLKSFFVKTDEPTNITADHEIQTGYNLYFGSSAEGRVQYNGLDMIIGLTSMASTGKLKLQCNSIDYLTINPVNSSIAIDSRVLNYDGASGQGFTFDNLNRPVLLSTLQMNAGIATKTQNISYSGTLNTGLEFTPNNSAYFKNPLIAEYTGVDYCLQVEGTSWLKDNIRIGTSYISNNGTNNGIQINSSNQVSCNNGLVVNGGNINCAGGGTITGSGGLISGSDISSFTYIRSGTSLELKDGIITPSATIGYAKIFVDSTDGDLKVIFGNGFVYTIAPDS